MSNIKSNSVCPNCGSVISEDAKFCLACGQPVYMEQVQNTMVCSKCGKTVPAGKFCPECGWSVVAQPGNGGKTKSGKGSALVAAIITLLVCIIVGLVIVMASGMLSGNDDDDRDSDRDEQITDDARDDGEYRNENEDNYRYDNEDNDSDEPVRQTENAQTATEPVKSANSAQYAALFADCKVGDVVYYGTYGGEDISWIVLDVVDGKALLLSEYVLDCVPYNEDDVGCTWSNCSLRTWLNDNFLNDAFTKEEQSVIAMSTVKADKNPKYDTNPGRDTQDQVFLLSAKEVEEYIGSKDLTAYPTAYACEQKLDIRDDGTCVWWTRSPGPEATSAAAALFSGCRGLDVDADHVGVRPAMWVEMG